VSQDSDEIRRQIRTLLARQLEPAAWAEIDDALATIVAALDRGDDATVARQRARIREAASRRFSRGVDARLGQPDRRPAAETTRTLTNKVVDRLAPPRDQA
jgi:hypothetical protein